ncbi:glycosyl hydrolase family 61 [Colletotrichum graminicola]|uniref:lytic cellulose monooxygenase (C4-dehydrogenating) n=1 Tax=Colletotrichum graminicola (strain M1.001 / M2 / FGSC 10212) TaxID=645133 RepID=E3QXG8_COLGM|nr:glycosyl hydrolase family 61 [Colletotrichum graminicola M1.001]EFQ35556.1 glycosyl hydrolase family 61 [Colletotrichum graminicola M1.001]WDK19586.1 glycosyl hydrolase family 61 [Colletotrichum graminicola]
MRFSFTAAALAALVGYSSAHTMVVDIHVNGKNAGDGRSLNGQGSKQYIRSPPSNDPVKDLKSASIVCNVNGGKAAKDFAPLAAGDKVAFEWFHNTPGDDILDASHKGPVITYIAPFTEDAGTGPIWTKIGEEGFSSGKWATDKLIANKGVSGDVTVPASLKAGKYLLRQEIIALHEADTTFDVNPARGAQFYPSCVQVEVSGTGSDAPPQKFDFNTGYTYADTGIKFNVYGTDGSTYKIPGPEVWTGGAGSGSDSAPAPAPAPSDPDTGCQSRRSLKERRSAHY